MGGVGTKYSKNYSCIEKLGDKNSCLQCRREKNPCIKRTNFMQGKCDVIPSLTEQSIVCFSHVEAVKIFTPGD